MICVYPNAYSWFVMLTYPQASLYLLAFLAVGAVAGVTLANWWRRP